jgi:ketosteroid isomerase-like protein
MKTLFSFALILLVAACQAPSAEMSEAEIAQIEAQVSQAISDQWDDFTVALKNLDYEGWRSFWTSDARVLQPGMDQEGSALFDTVTEMFSSGLQFSEFEVESFDVFVHGDVAYQIGKYDELTQMPGEAPTEYHDHFFARWEKEDGFWKIDRFMGSPREAPEEG